MKNKPKIFGLILTGGFSKRMGKEKALLDYHGKPQFAHLFDLLKPFCKNVFLSCRETQAVQFDKKYPLIFDLHDGIGPMNGLLSFFEKHPTKACLLIACDMPFIDKKALQILMTNRDAEKIATVFKSQKGFPEPLLSIWEPKSYNLLNDAFLKKQFSLRDLLQENDCRILPTNDDKTLLNINHPEELETVRKLLNLPPEKL